MGRSSAFRSRDEMAEREIVGVLFLLRLASPPLSQSATPPVRNRSATHSPLAAPTDSPSSSPVPPDSYPGHHCWEIEHCPSSHSSPNKRFTSNCLPCLHPSIDTRLEMVGDLARNWYRRRWIF
ncbi:unnamed protein product [Linum trigynum]|uniref:Uncharacterized protein n=1 Tax=Linum trigynum TaxID=586398 RepID=A0AAV2EPU4_9ROSI